MPRNSPAQQVAHTVREQLRSRKISQEALASRLGITQQAVSRRLIGDVDFSLEQIVIVAEVLDTSVEALVADSHTSSDPSPLGSDETAGDVPAGSTPESAVPPAAPSGAIALADDAA